VTKVLSYSCQLHGLIKFTQIQLEEQRSLAGLQGVVNKVELVGEITLSPVFLSRTLVTEKELQV
jgi:hypothetical protein